MNAKKSLILLFILCFLPLISISKTFKWTSQGDILTLDPHSQNESLNIAANLWVYDPLVRYDENFKISPSLSISWEKLSPISWRFNLRKDVKFHDGSSLTADDVVFSIKRAMDPSSQFKSYAAGIKDVKALNSLTVLINTDGSNPVLLKQLTVLGIMSKSWAEKNNSLSPQNYNKKEENFAARNAMGTGPYKLKSREVDVKTEYIENENWWGHADKKGNVTEIIYIPIKQNASRTAALLSGEVDFILDPAVQDLELLRNKVKIMYGNEYRTIFIGMDQESQELKYSNIKGVNPFKDIRVREALYRAVDIELLKKSIMKGLSSPTGTMIAPQVIGYSEKLAQRVPYDLEKSKKLLQEAGYENRLELTLDCPNNRYINDESICQALVSMWAKVGVKVKLNSMPRALYFPKIGSKDTSIFLFGWGVPTFDAYFTLESIVHTKGDGPLGAFNYGRYSNLIIDRLIDEIKNESNEIKRISKINQALTLYARDFGAIPLHDQVTPWAMKKNIKMIHRADNRPVVEWIIIE